jgi:hypothetical protein
LRNETQEAAPEEPRKVGRPKQWEDAGARLRNHRAQAAEQRRLVKELIAAARDARWTDDLHRRIQFGSDMEVLQTLIEHYRSRCWSRHRTPGPEEGGPLPPG